MKDDRPVHEHEHAEPTVIHHPEEDMTALARWLKHGMEQGTKFWLLVAGVVVVLVVVAVISSGLVASKSPTSEAWVELTQAKTPEERLKIAEAYPNTPVASWAKLMSAEEEYSNGIDALTTPGKKELAGPRLKKALELFQEVAKDAPKDSSQALGGMLGAARTLEARNELPEAIEQYRLVASKFPNTPEAKQALELAKALEEPVNATFYKELYAYKPPANPGPGLGGPGSLIPPPSSFGTTPGSSLKSFIPDLPLPPGLDALPPSTSPIPAPSTTTIPLEAPKTETPKTTEAPKAEAPKTEAPKTEAPKAEAPKTETPAPPTTPAAPVEAPKVATPPK
jgi:hypothetical protein